MLAYPQIDPVAISLGPLQVHWYGLMYLIGFLGGWGLGRLRAADPNNNWTKKEVDDLLFYIVLGVVLGGRMGYVLFYNFGVFLDDPLLILRIWQGGMSFHGGLMGVLIAMLLFGKRFNRTFFESNDFIAPFICVGLGAGRIGNFINQELWGKVTDLPWGMVFPLAGPEPRHPSMLYEAILEGPVFFLILWIFSSKPRPRRAVSGMFLLFYGLFRFAVEFVRLPDAHIGYLAFGWFTMGHLLTIPMLFFGVLLLWLAYRHPGDEKAA